jgi:psp operon transcriptional activator
VRVDVRIVAATNEHLPRLVEEGRFRADLLDRLSFEVVTLPPLRHRESDIPVLADHFGRRMALELEWDRWPGFSKSAQEQLLGYEWPGNVRELRNVVERAVYRWGGWDSPIDALEFDPFASPFLPMATITARPAPASPASAPFPIGGGSAAPDGGGAVLTGTVMPPLAGPAPYDPAACADFRLAIAEYEKAILTAALEKCRWNQRQAAKELKLSYDQLRHALRRHELQ